MVEITVETLKKVLKFAHVYQQEKQKAVYLYENAKHLEEIFHRYGYIVHMNRALKVFTCYDHDPLLWMPKISLRDTLQKTTGIKLNGI